MARLTAQMLSTSLGQMIVDNKPGAGGTLAGREAARAEPDGYTLLFGSSATLAIGPALYGNSGYDPVKSFTPIAMVSSVPYVMIGATNAPFKTVPELLAYAKANPGTLNWGVPNGAPPHMLAEMFKMQTGADIQVVPYKGASTLITDMLAGRIHGGFETTSVMLAHLHEGNIRGLAVLRDSPHSGTARRAHHGRKRRAGRRRLVLVGRAGARRHPAGYRRTPARPKSSQACAPTTLRPSSSGWQPMCRT